MLIVFWMQDSVSSMRDQQNSAEASFSLSVCQIWNKT